MSQTGDEGKPADRGESVRSWYERTTSRWRTALYWATGIALAAGAVLYLLAPFGVLAKLQTFNGAMTIPVAALIWIMAFVYIFLVPNREVGFRSMESLERMERRVEEAVEKRINPVVSVWQRIGERVERELPEFIKEGRESFDTLKRVATKLESMSEKNEELAAEARPVIESLRRISERVERENLLDEAKAAFESVKTMGGIPKDATEPDVGRALSSIRKR